MLTAEFADGGYGGYITGQTEHAEVIAYLDGQTLNTVAYRLATEQSVTIEVEAKTLRVVRKKGVTLPSSR